MELGRSIFRRREAPEDELTINEGLGSLSEEERKLMAQDVLQLIAKRSAEPDFNVGRVCVALATGNLSDVYEELGVSRDEIKTAVSVLKSGVQAHNISDQDT